MDKVKDRRLARGFRIPGYGNFEFLDQVCYFDLIFTSVKAWEHVPPTGCGINTDKDQFCCILRKAIYYSAYLFHSTGCGISNAVCLSGTKSKLFWLFFIFSNMNILPQDNIMLIRFDNVQCKWNQATLLSFWSYNWIAFALCLFVNLMVV